MEEKDKWIKNFRTRMEDYSEPAPADLWEQLEKELNVPKTIPMWRRWQAVAAVALLVVVSSLTVWFRQSPLADFPEHRSAELNSIHQPDRLIPETAVPAQPTTRIVPVTPSTNIQRMKIAQAAVIKALPVEQGELINEIMEDKQIKEDNKEVPQDEPVVTETKPQSAARPIYSGKKNNYAYAAPRKNQDRNWSIGLSTGNGTFTSSSSVDGYVPTRGTRNVQVGSLTSSSYEVQVRSDAYNQMLFNNISSENKVKSDIKHRMPVTFGASLRFDLSDNWAIETGVTYTQLSSELRSGAKDNFIEEEQKLHYVGVPLKVDRRIWSNKRFEVYASAGGAVEKCVSGKLNSSLTVRGEKPQPGKEENIKVKPLQWSLSAAAGAQFKITEKLGIYAEPGVVYYFDDGSDVSTIRKEHPFNFNIQLGVRFTLPK